MKIHKEGLGTILVVAAILIILNGLLCYFLPEYRLVRIAVAAASVLLFVFTVSFFRVPARKYTFGQNKIIAPADGKVVVIEEMVDNEYFKDKRLQVSIFMSPLNVHVNRYPVSGEVVYNKYYKGKYLVAWDPKSSTDNERQSIVIKESNGKELLVKQIAGAMARRICNYARVGEQVKQDDELGFIKFGSRVDLLMPTDAKVQVRLGEAVTGGVSVIATW